jgi:serine/threonine protein kinase
MSDKRTESWPRVRALFEEAIDLDGDARERLLTHAAETDPDITREVQALLSTHARAGAFLETPAWAADPALLDDVYDGPHYPPGRQVGPYRIIEEIGRGGMGIVYAAEDERLGRQVALKALPPSFTKDAAARERLAREARAAAALTHPNIATVYAFEEIDGEPFIASELVRGNTLRMELAEGPLPPERLLPTLLEIASALEAAHRQGIIHRDLKPENVLRAADGRVKIVDFGLARTTTNSSAALTTLTVAGSMLGTPGYMAPEQLRGETLDARTDIFAFGVMAYEIGTGVHPFGGYDPAAVLERLVSETPALSRTVQPPALDAIVRRCLQGDRVNRFTNGGDLYAALTGVSAEPTTDSGTAGIVPLGSRRWWWWQFHQVAVAVLSAATLVPVWLSRSWLRPWGSAVFLGVLVLVTLSITLRLHLWFASHVHPHTFPAQRARTLPWIVALEGALLAGLTGIALTVAGDHDPIAAWLVVTALLLLVSLAVIEPATTRAALD